MEVIAGTGATLKSINCFIEDGSFSYVESNTSVGKSFSLRDQEVEFKTGRFYGRMRERR